MTPQHPISTRLREARVARNISTSELQARARIREHLIEAIDEGRFDELPPVYMRSFLRRYAEHVGVPPQEMEDLISRHLDAAGAHAAKGTSRLLPFFGASETPSVSRIPVEGSNNRRRILNFLVSLFGIACLAGFYLLLRGPSDGTSSTDRQNLLRSVDSLIGPSEPAGKLMNYFGVAPQDSLSLEATCTDTVWITITVDKKFTDIVTLSPGQQRTWSGAESFQLSVRNAGGVTFKRNGIDLPRIGKIGETVRSIRITRTEFITSASPWRSQRDTTKGRTATAKPSTINATTARPPAAASGKPTVQRPPTVTIPPRGSAVPAASVIKPKTPTAVAPSRAAAPPRATTRPAPVRQPVETPKEKERRLRLERIRQEAKKRDLTPVIVR
ncbi:MAG: RodZ domain-containing protein [Candidatus Kapaibacterium sp.]